MDSLPSNIYNKPWLIEKNTSNKFNIEKKQFYGAWILYFNDLSSMDDIWKLALKFFREGKLNGVHSIKCHTNYVNTKSIIPTVGVLVFNCFLPLNEEIILESGKNILELFNYDERKTIYYKIKEHAIKKCCLPNSKNYTYKLNNYLYGLKNTEFAIIDNKK